MALQGAFREHREVLDALGVEAVEVRNASDLGALDALILPGGESTTMSKLLDSSEVREPLGALLADGFPVFGTCAGMILLAREVLDGRPDQRSFGAIDCSVRRNGYGRQRDSFEAALDVRGLGGGPFPGVFIRATRGVGGSRGRGARDPRRRARAHAVRQRVGVELPSGAVRRSPNPSTVRQRGDPAMSGHSKWHSIKHAKGAADAARGKAFARLARQIEVAARDGGGDVEANPTLRSMIQKARDASMPKDNIERGQARHR